MPSKGLFVIGTNLMVLVHVHSFVLLTANFEDVKKLAQKFVSESIAETIAEFVAKATGKSIDMNTSKVNNVPISRNSQLDSDPTSEEDKETNTTKESISKENVKYKSKTFKKTHKAKFQSKFLKSSEERSNKRKDKNIKSKENKKSKMKYISKSNKLNDFSENSATNDISVESKDSYLDEVVPDKNLTSDQDEDSAFDSGLKNELREEKFKIERSFTLTTRKEKIEFDQYINTNHLKAVATSGSVTLKRLFDLRKSRYRE